MIRQATRNGMGVIDLLPQGLVTPGQASSPGAMEMLRSAQAGTLQPQGWGMWPDRTGPLQPPESLRSRMTMGDAFRSTFQPTEDMNRRQVFHQQFPDMNRQQWFRNVFQNGTGKGGGSMGGLNSTWG